MSTSYSLIVVCGLHRSGTTYVGEILRQAGVVVVHEPLNERYGMADVPIAYPFVEQEEGVFASLLDDAVNFSRPWGKNLTWISVKGLKRLVYSLTGGRSGLRWSALRVLKRLGFQNGMICLKDPFMSLATPYLVRKFGIPIVCMVRHPAAIHYSTNKQSWRFNVENLLRQPELIARYGADIPTRHWDVARENSAASIALLWKFMIRINSALQDADRHLLMVTHEELCLQPQQVSTKICDHFGIPFIEKLELFVSQNSEGGSAEAAKGKIHDFKRDSRALVEVWRSRIEKNDEVIMREIVADEVVRFYGKW